MTSQRTAQGSTAAETASFGAAHRARILLVDDHPIVRQGLALTLREEADLCVCGQVASAREALDAVPKLHPHIALVDLGLEGSHGIDLIKDLRLQFPDVRVLVLSMHDEKLYAERALRAGAHGYIMKKESPDRVVGAIRKVLQGGIYFSDAITTHLLEMRKPGKRLHEDLPLESLTDRELEILELVGNGLKTQRIAEVLGVSMKTVQAHRENIKVKLGFTDANSLTCFASRWAESERGIHGQPPP
jgi:DNA-binding NarL/FixJ family response regulator